MVFRIDTLLTPKVRHLVMVMLAGSGLLGTSAAWAQGDAGICKSSVAVNAASVVAAASDIPPPPGPQAVATAADYQGTHSGFPRWSDFPPPPQNVPTESDIRLRVIDLKGVRDTYLTSVGKLTWDMTDPDAFQAQAFARIDANKMAAIETKTCEQILEFARQQQKLATPPPVADN